MESVRRVFINSLEPYMDHIMIIGVIIGKQNPRIINTNKRDLTGEKGVWNFTIRDSPHDLINAAYWGSSNFINKISQDFNIGDVVEICNFKVSSRSSEEERYRPVVTSPFQITLNEHQSSLSHYRGDDLSKFLSLLSLTSKPPHDYFTLADVINAGDAMRGDSITLLAAVSEVSPKRIIKTYDVRQITTRNITLFDELHQMHLQLWNIGSVDRAEMWNPRGTILFLADIRVEWNNFRRGMVANDTNRTIITENPEFPEAQKLRDYLQKAPPSFGRNTALDRLVYNYPDPTSIRNSMTVQQIFEKLQITNSSSMPSDGDLNEDSENSSRQQFPALLYCIVTNYDLDGPESYIINYKCSFCDMKISSQEPFICTNTKCSGSEKSSTHRSNFYKIFDIKINLSDHTGTLENCRLHNRLAEKLIGFTAQEFSSIQMEFRTKLKWRFLLERCAVRILALEPTDRWPTPSFSILSLEIADPSEAVSGIPIY